MFDPDAWVIDKFDKAATTIQKRGWVPLNTLIMGGECLTWPAWSVYLYKIEPLPIGLITTGWAGVILYIAFNEWKDAHGYWENHRKTMNLNARVLHTREHKKLRMFIVIVLLLISVIELISSQIEYMIITTGWITVAYLKCCRYIGPGEYAKQRKETYSSLPQES